MHKSVQPQVAPVTRSIVTTLLILLALSSLSGSPAHAAATYLLAYPAAPYDSPSGTYTLKADNTTIPVTSFTVAATVTAISPLGVRPPSP